MTRTNDILIMKSSYLYDNDSKELLIDFEEIDSTEINSLTDIHIYERVAKRDFNYICNESFKREIVDTLKTVIISDFDLRTADEKYKEEFFYYANMNCFHVEYDTIDYTIIQLS